MKNKVRTNPLSPEHPIHRHEPRNRAMDRMLIHGEERMDTSSRLRFLTESISMEYVSCIFAYGRNIQNIIGL